MPQFYRAEPVVPQAFNPLESYGQVLQLKGMANRNRADELQMQQAQRKQQDVATFLEALGQNQGDWETTLKALRGKISPETQLAFEEHFQANLKNRLDAKKVQGDIDKTGQDVAKARTERLAQVVAEAWQLPDEELAARTDEFIGRAKAIDPDLKIPPGPLSKAHLKVFGVMLQAEQYTAHVADEKSKAEKSRYDMLSAKKDYEAGITPGTKGQTDFEQAFQRDKGRQPTLGELVQHKREMAQAGRAVVGGVSPGRSDKSYQYESGRLDKVQEPIDTAVARLGRLADTINQVTPQADALVAPELLTVMAGGQGSGLRMNEAEIARIVGGRTNLESFKAALNKWQVDPSEGLSITPSQRQQVRTLMGEVQKKLLAKQQLLESARQQLINSDDPAEHRRITAAARAGMSEIDSGKMPSASAGISVTDPRGGVHRFPNQAAADAFKKAAGIK